MDKNITQLALPLLNNAWLSAICKALDATLVLLKNLFRSAVKVTERIYQLL
jgi:hypothetical protein